MNILRSVKVRLYPNRTQEQTLNKVLGCYRFVYNHMLALKMDAYNSDKTNLKLTELSKYFHGTLLKDEDYAWLKEQNTKVMKQSIRQMLTAYDRFFGQHNGFPKFKSKKDKQSALFPYDAVSKNNTFETKSITLTKNLKDIRFRCSKLYHQRLRHYAKSIKNATLSKTKSGKFFLSILLEVDNDEYRKFGKTDQRVGIDLGVKDFVITSDGEVFENKHFHKKFEKRAKRLQRQMSRKAKGSNNRNKARIKLARLFERMSNRKEQYIHYVVNELLTYYDVVFMEDLNTKGMLRNHHLAKAIQEVGFYRFKTVLVDKATVNGKQVHFVGRFYPSSKTCSKCGHINSDLTLGDREWVCLACGEHHDRDINAAVNILSEGNRLLAA